MRALKYLMVFTLPLTVYISFYFKGFWTFLPLIYSFAVIPLLELFFPAATSNLTEEEEESMKKDRIYDFLLYLILPVHLGFLILFFYRVNDASLLWWETVGRVSAMGIMCGVFGINVAHELGHRNTKYEQFMSKVLLLTSLYMHFFIEHNRGHHKKVSTPEDPSSARFGESLYAFWFRSVVNAYRSAWNLEFERMNKIGAAKFSLKNEMLQFQLIQIIAVAAVYYFFGWIVMLYFVSSAVFGFLLLETVNYIEHYGLSRNKISDDRYERVLPAHSWNSDHMIGRLLLFELSRHSDHHFMANRKYQILRHMEDSPQMPTGYPGMMLLSIVPPIWFAVIHYHMRKHKLITNS